MFKHIVFICMALLFSSVVNSAMPKQKGGYIGIAAGASEIDDDGFFNDPDWADAGLDVDLSDDEDSSIQLFGGYRFNKHFALEARYIDFGEFDLDATIIGVGSAQLDLEFEAISAHAVGILPLGAGGWELFGQLGLARVELELAGDDEDETVVSAGLGVRYFATESLAIGLQVDTYVWEEDDFSKDYDVALSTGQISLSYIF